MYYQDNYIIPFDVVGDDNSFHRTILFHAVITLYPVQSSLQK